MRRAARLRRAGWRILSGPPQQQRTAVEVACCSAGGPLQQGAAAAERHASLGRGARPPSPIWYSTTGSSSAATPHAHNEHQRQAYSRAAGARAAPVAPTAGSSLQEQQLLQRAAQCSTLRQLVQCLRSGTAPGSSGAARPAHSAPASSPPPDPITAEPVLPIQPLSPSAVAQLSSTALRLLTPPPRQKQQLSSYFGRPAPQQAAHAPGNAGGTLYWSGNSKARAGSGGGTTEAGVAAAEGGGGEARELGQQLARGLEAAAWAWLRSQPAAALLLGPCDGGAVQGAVAAGGALAAGGGEGRGVAAALQHQCLEVAEQAVQCLAALRPLHAHLAEQRPLTSAPTPQPWPALPQEEDRGVGGSLASSSGYPVASWADAAPGGWAALATGSGGAGSVGAMQALLTSALSVACGGQLPAAAAAALPRLIHQGSGSVVVWEDVRQALRTLPLQPARRLVALAQGMAMQAGARDPAAWHAMGQLLLPCVTGCRGAGAVAPGTEAEQQWPGDAAACGLLAPAGPRPGLPPASSALLSSPHQVVAVACAFAAAGHHHAPLLGALADALLQPQPWAAPHGAASAGGGGGGPEGGLAGGLLGAVLGAAPHGQAPGNPGLGRAGCMLEALPPADLAAVMLAFARVEHGDSALLAACVHEASRWLGTQVRLAVGGWLVGWLVGWTGRELAA